MNAVDMIIIGVVVVLGLIGLRSGLLKPVSGIGGLIIGIILAVQFSTEFATMLTQSIEGELPSTVAAFGGIVIATTLVARMASWMVKKILKTLMLGWVDRIAGALGGVALGVLTLVEGAVGTGKSVLCQHLAYGALMSEQRVTIYVHGAVGVQR